MLHINESYFVIFCWQISLARVDRIYKVNTILSSVEEQKRRFNEEIVEIRDVYRNNSSNFETTLMKLSEKIYHFSILFIAARVQFAGDYGSVSSLWHLDKQTKIIN